MTYFSRNFSRVFQLPYRCVQSLSNLSGATSKSQSPSAQMLTADIMKAHFKNSGLTDEQLTSIPASYFRRRARTKNLFVADPKVARDIASTICPRLSGHHILEFDVGIGLMSDVFAKHNPNLRVYEHNQTLVHFLQDKFKDQGNVKVFNESFNNLMGILFSEETSAEKDLDRLTTGLPEAPWSESISISMILPVSRLRQVQALLRNFINYDSLRRFGRPEFFFLIPQNIYKILTSPQSESNGRYRSIGYLYNIFCDIEVLSDNLPATSFLPWAELKKNAEEATQHMSLLRVVPKFDRFAPIEDMKFIKALLVLTRSALLKNKRIIPMFESYAEDCGPKFIVDHDLTTYTEFFDVTPEEYYLLTKQLVKYPQVYESMLNTYNY